MANHVISSALIRVVIGNQVFDLPQEKAQQLMSMVRQWQSVSIPENNYGGHNAVAYNGMSLIQG
jgi:hypothetical protein